MPSQPFVLYSAFQAVRGYALGAYRPFYIKQDGEKVKNPKFDNHSQQILNLKDPSKPWYGGAVSYCAKELVGFLQNEIKVEAAEILIVPSSQKGQVSAGLEKIVQYACKVDKRFTYAQGALARTKTIEKLAKGGDRSLQVHLESLSYKGRDGSPTVKIIIDDVMTTGHSLEGAMTVINQVADGLTYIPVVLGKTTHD